MTTVQIRNDTLHVKMNLLETIFAFRRKFEIPLENVRRVQAEDLPLTKGTGHHHHRPGGR